MDALLKALGPVLGKSVIVGIILLLASAVLGLSLYVKALINNIDTIREAAKREIVECEQRSAREKDAMRLEYIGLLNAAIERQRIQEEKLNKIKRRK